MRQAITHDNLTYAGVFDFIVANPYTNTKTPTTDAGRSHDV